MTIYLSGPISGYSDRNTKSFKKANNEIKKLFPFKNLKIINPVKLGILLDKRFEKAGKAPPAWEDYMRMCIKELCQSDFVFLLPNWGYSQGAVVEKYLAERLKIPCAENINKLLNLISGEIK